MHVGKGTEHARGRWIWPSDSPVNLRAFWSYPEKIVTDAKEFTNVV